MEHSVHTKIHPPFHPSRDSREDADLLCISLQPLVLAKLNARCQLGSHLSPQECFEHTASPGPIINCQFQRILFELDTVGHTLLVLAVWLQHLLYPGSLVALLLVSSGIAWALLVPRTAWTPVTGGCSHVTEARALCEASSYFQSVCSAANTKRHLANLNWCKKILS